MASNCTIAVKKQAREGTTAETNQTKQHKPTGAQRNKSKQGREQRKETSQAANDADPRERGADQNPHTNQPNTGNAADKVNDAQRTVS